MNLKKPNFWDQKTPNLFAYLLLPIALIIRIFIYFKKKPDNKKMNIKTICIGNFYIGGTGKTSLCIKINQILEKRKIKGTIKRNSNKEIDTNNKIQLKNSSKDFSENVMIVDLVRNDLSKVSKKSSVKVDELYKPYSFEQVHHLISTVKAKIKPGISSIDSIEDSLSTDTMNFQFSLENETGSIVLESSIGAIDYMINESFTMADQATNDQGQIFETEAGTTTSSTADDILDFSERNPFGEVDF